MSIIRQVHSRSFPVTQGERLMRPDAQRMSMLYQSQWCQSMLQVWVITNKSVSSKLVWLIFTGLEASESGPGNQEVGVYSVWVLCHLSICLFLLKWQSVCALVNKLSCHITLTSQHLTSFNWDSDQPLGLTFLQKCKKNWVPCKRDQKCMWVAYEAMLRSETQQHSLEAKFTDNRRGKTFFSEDTRHLHLKKKNNQATARKLNTEISFLLIASVPWINKKFLGTLFSARGWMDLNSEYEIHCFVST